MGGLVWEPLGIISTRILSPLQFYFAMGILDNLNLPVRMETMGEVFRLLFCSLVNEILAETLYLNKLNDLRKPKKKKNFKTI